MNPITPVPSIGNYRAGAEAPNRLTQAAREFEGQLLFSLLHSLEKSFSALPAGSDQNTEGSGYSDMATEALATALSNAGGLGIATLLVRHLGSTKVLP
jgi:Rod binding domain-containing protein